MIVATRLSAVWQVAGVAGAALCCYLVSQSVASERTSLEKVDQQIAQTHDDIAKLQTEIGVRARQGQLEAWNRDVLALQAPRPSQFVSGGVQLASLYGHHGQPALQLDPTIAPQQGAPIMAAYRPAPAAPAQPQPTVSAPAETAAAAPAQPMLRSASFVRPISSRLGASAGDAAPTVQRASFEVIKTSTPASHVDVDNDALKHAKAAVKPVEKLSKLSNPAPKLSEPKPADLKPLKVAEAKPAATKPKVEPIRLAARDPLPKSLLPADIGALAAREAKSSKATR